MNNSNLINVGLYGAGSRRARLRAEYIYCNHADECSAYKNGKCFCVTTLFGTRCEYGRISCIDGCTKQSKTYWKVYNEATSNEKYAKLGYPYYDYIIRIGDNAFITLPYVQIEKAPGGMLYCKDPGFGRNRLLVSTSDLIPENIKRICEFLPQAFMGGKIGRYQKEAIPLFLQQFSLLFPTQFVDFLSAYPEYEIKPPNWIGRCAKLSTCNREVDYKDVYGNNFHFEGDYLVCDKYHLSFLPFGAREAEIRVKVTNDMEVKITDNEQVTADTVFV